MIVLKPLRVTLTCSGDLAVNAVLPYLRSQDVDPGRPPRGRGPTPRRRPPSGSSWPVVELLGGEARPLPAYDSFGLVDPVKDRPMLKASTGSGFGAVKVKAGDASEGIDGAAGSLAALLDLFGPWPGYVAVEIAVVAAR